MVRLEGAKQLGLVNGLEGCCKCLNRMVEHTLPETNIAPGNEWLEDEVPFGMVYFEGFCYFQGLY